jgi:alpha-tubulin suppressor-like RCC1 family protein
MDDEGKLGNGPMMGSSDVPGDVVGLSSDVMGVATGTEHTCAVTMGGAVECWGHGFKGELGNGSIQGPNSQIPVAVVGLESGVVSVVAGDRYSCALTEAGAVKCWGDGPPTASPIPNYVPVDVAGLPSDVASISSDFDHVCALTRGGAVWCWGTGIHIQLANGSTTVTSAQPIAVPSLSGGVASVSAGVDYSCAALLDGGIACWGSNADGELGDGTTATSSVPVRAKGF